MAKWVSFADLECSIGTEMAKVLCCIRGGVVTYVPKNVDVYNDLAPFIGMPALSALARDFGGERIEIPKKSEEPYKWQILSLLDKGMSHRDIALQVGVTDRYVRQLSNLSGRSRKQCSLWD